MDFFLKSFVIKALVLSFILLVFVDVLDDIFFGSKWAGCPKEYYPIIGAIVAGLFGTSLLLKGGK